MPGNPTVMRLRGEKINKLVSVSPTAREEQKEKKLKKKEEPTIAPWIVGLMLFALIGSAFVNIFVSIQTSPSMSEAH